MSKRLITCWQLLNHSVLAVLIGALVVPFLIDRLAQQRLEQENRRRVAQILIENGLRGERELGTFSTLLALFEKDAREGEPLEVKALQQTYRATFNERYIDFDRFIWWWAHQVRDEVASTPGITEVEREALERLGQAYNEAVLRSLGWLDRVVTSHLRIDPVNNHTALFADAGEARQQFGACGDVRRRILGEMSFLFSLRAPEKFPEYVSSRSLDDTLQGCAAALAPQEEALTASGPS